MLEQSLTLPGFLYDLGGTYYFLGKWICRKCSDIDASDCVHMYGMCRNAGEEQETSFYFNKSWRIQRSCFGNSLQSGAYPQKYGRAFIIPAGICL